MRTSIHNIVNEYELNTFTMSTGLMLPDYVFVFVYMDHLNFATSSW